MIIYPSFFDSLGLFIGYLRGSCLRSRLMRCRRLCRRLQIRRRHNNPREARISSRSDFIHAQHGFHLRRQAQISLTFHSLSRSPQNLMILWGPLRFDRFAANELPQIVTADFSRGAEAPCALWALADSSLGEGAEEEQGYLIIIHNNA